MTQTTKPATEGGGAVAVERRSRFATLDWRRYVIYIGFVVVFIFFADTARRPRLPVPEQPAEHLPADRDHHRHRGRHDLCDRLCRDRPQRRLGRRPRERSDGHGHGQLGRSRWGHCRPLGWRGGRLHQRRVGQPVSDPLVPGHPRHARHRGRPGAVDHRLRTAANPVLRLQPGLRLAATSVPSPAWWCGWRSSSPSGRSC